MAESRTRGSTSGQTIPPLSTSDFVRFWKYVQVGEGCWNWTGTGVGKGYGGFSHGPRGTNRTLLAHRVAYRIQHGSIPEGMTVSHLCHNRRCVRDSHLVVESIKANLGRSIRGEKHRDAKLTEDQVRNIRTDWWKGTDTQKGIADKYGVSVGTVAGIIHRRTWKWLS